ncbi:pilus assembly protein PilL [Gluconacetobacter diazotrophicus]|uniref:Pilus assembly protein PilL n=1 Tax=Gluconacetobacter diazotrophicus TaxID=33996 RepID=A0A7W4FF51_GLUDI|nr:toxin co-regulated pilus biosynthesis Q family protein [Gluconacetobacter diazotrophicus]MBB2156626.1 pilus assembly protein PilL [Gluconacetobacter diazotrophicus]
MRKPALAALLAAATALAGCATAPPEHLSIVDGASFRDASRLTVTIADILAASMTPATTTISVRPVAGADPMRVSTLLDDTLRERGFALAPSGMAYPGAHNVRYSISPVDGDVELVLDVDSANATCLFGHDAEGALVLVGSCSVLSTDTLALTIPRDAMPESATHLTRGRPMDITPPRATPVPASSSAVAPAAPRTALPAQPVHAAPPPVIRPTWTLVEGQPIRDQMLAWGDRAGWRVFWPRDVNWIVPVTTTFTGQFDGDAGVLAQVANILSRQGKPLTLMFAVGNHSAIVTPAGAPHP